MRRLNTPRGAGLGRVASFLTALRRDRRGNVSIVFGLIGMCILMTIGIAIDMTRVALVRSSAQSALDNAVLAATGDSLGTWAANAQQIFATNFANRLNAAAETDFVRDADHVVTGTAVVTVPMTLAEILGQADITVTVKAAAARLDPPGMPVCVLLLGPNSQSLLANGGAALNAPDCAVHVKSTANPAAIFNAGTTLTTKQICIQGSNIIANGGQPANLSLGCQTAADPFAGTLPAPPSTTCEPAKQNLNFNGGIVSMSPGVYCGWTNFNGTTTVNFAPGVYVIKSGGWNVGAGSWTGNGVTFYFDDTSKIQFNSGISANLAAPTAGTYAGLLFYEKPGLASSQFIFNTTAGHRFTGLFHLPSRDVTLNGGANVTANAVTLVFRSLIHNSANWKITPGTKPIIGGVANGTTTVATSYLTR